MPIHKHQDNVSEQMRVRNCKTNQQLIYKAKTEKKGVAFELNWVTFHLLQSSYNLISTFPIVLR